MIIFSALIPVFLMLGLVLISPLIANDKRPDWFFLSIMALGCSGLDVLFLALLPLLGLSFAPSLLPPLLLFSIGRAFVLVPGLLGLLRAQDDKRRKVTAKTFVAFQVILLILVFYGMFIEPFALTTTTLQVTSPDFLQGRPLRVLQISDLHVERITRREQEILSQVKELRPDIIVLTGDYMNIDYTMDARTRSETHQVLAQLQAPMGVFAIAGTPGVDVPEAMPELFNGLDIRILDNETAFISFPGGDLAIIGIGYEQRDRDAGQLSALMQTIPSQTFTLLLYHTPDLMYEADKEDVDLYLAGHTHGGQVRLPFYGAIITFSTYGKAFEMGKYHRDTTTLYVSRGLGMEGLYLPRIRFLAPPELVLIELTPAVQK